jgi:molybdopterin converting factor small subunit
MGVQVRVPAMLGDETILVTEYVATIADLLRALARVRPALTQRLEDPIFNFAVNDELLLHNASSHALKDGDVVEIVPAISGG